MPATSAWAGASTARPRSFRPSRTQRRYDEERTELPDWRIGCIFTGKGHRREGVARAALTAALAAIKEAGGGLVEAYPEQVEGREPQRGAYFHTGPENLFAEFGFERDRQDRQVALGDAPKRSTLVPLMAARLRRHSPPPTAHTPRQRPSLRLRPDMARIVVPRTAAGRDHDELSAFLAEGVVILDVVSALRLIADSESYSLWRGCAGAVRRCRVPRRLSKLRRCTETRSTGWSAT